MHGLYVTVIYPIVHCDQAANYINLLLSISATSSFHAYITNMLHHHNHPIAIRQRGIENDTEGRQSVNHFAQNIHSQNCNEKICANSFIIYAIF